MNCVRTCGHRGKCAGYHQKAGFTVIEMLVVMALIGILTLITISSRSRIGANNRTLSCQMNLRSIHQALMMYRADEDAYPAFLYPNPNTGGDGGLGLWALHIYGEEPPYTPVPLRGSTGQLSDYLRNVKRYQCPEDVTRSPTSVVGNPPFYQLSTGANGYNSYQLEDDEDRDGTVDELTYLPFRGVTDSSNPNYLRQLLPPSCVYDPNSTFAGSGGCPVGYAPRRVSGNPCAADGGSRFRGTPPCAANQRPGSLGLGMSSWHPREDTVVTWCPFHRNRAKPRGFDNVLFLDGSVQLLPSAACAGPECTYSVHDSCPVGIGPPGGMTFTPSLGNLWLRCPRMGTG